MLMLLLRVIFGPQCHLVVVLVNARESAPADRDSVKEWVS